MKDVILDILSILYDTFAITAMGVTVMTLFLWNPMWGLLALFVAYGLLAGSFRVRSRK